MKFLIVAFAVGVSLMSSVASGKDIKDLEGFYWENRPLLGHFKKEPFVGLYENYAASFVKPLFPERSLDDFRNYLPSADECMTFFSTFRIDKYKLRDLDGFIVLDACLGYLFESSYHEQDSEASDQVKSNLKVWLADEQLQALYKGTNILGLSWDAQECVGNLLLKSVYAKHQYPDQDCNQEWLKVFLDFAQCQHTIPEDQRDSDSYLKILYELVKIRGVQCFYNEIRVLNKAVRGEYANNLFYRAKTSASRSVPLSQSNERMWPKPIVELLRAVQNPSKGKEINLRQVSRLIRGVYLDREVPFLSNMAEYATKQIVDKKFGKSSLKKYPDPLGRRRYLELVDSLCNFFRWSDNKNFYDYTTPFVRMVAMLKYPEIFNISTQVFSKEVINHSHESGTLFFSVSICNLLTFTEGQFKHKAHNGPDEYEVVFKQDTRDMVVWPDTGFW